MNLYEELDSLGIFNQIIVYDIIELNCQNPVEFDDPGSQSNQTGGYPLHLANVPCAWTITTGDPNITVAVVDQYFDYTHDDLAGKLVDIKGICSPNVGSPHHGFATSGSVAAIVDNNYCTAGSGYNTTVAGYCVPGVGVYQSVLNAWQDGYKIINVSYTGTKLAEAMIQEIIDDGVTIVGASSNRLTMDKINDWQTEIAVPGVIIVSQVNSNFEYEPYDYFEGGVDIYAPCIWVNRLINNNSCGFGTGNTSFGAPLVAGIIALMKSVNYDLCPTDYEYLLNLTHQGLPANASSWPEMTAGIVDAEAAVLAAQSYQKYVIDSYIEWDEDKVVNELVIEPGGELVIKDGAVIKFGATAEVTVKRGARLIVDGSTLTVNPCSGEFWRGINIWGNFDLEQPNPYGTLDVDRAGIVVVKNSSLIEKARSALMTSKKDAEWDSQYWGGVILCENSQFIGNNRVAEFMKYDLPNNSRFYNCTFNGLRHGITIWSSRGIEFEKCRFYNMSEQGLLLWDSQVKVTDANDFHYNKVGIRSMATHPFSGKTIVGADGIDPNYFLDNFIHIRSEATSFGAGLSIINNEFFNGNTAVTVLGPSSYEVRDNAIVDPVVGVYSFQSGGVGFDQHNYVEDNAISALVGVVAEGKNRELQVRCNLFDATRDFMIRQAGYVSSGDQGEIREHQGSNKGGANNCFTNPLQIADIETSGQTLHFNYWVSGTATCLIPITSGNYDVENAVGPSCNSLLPPFSPPYYSHYVTLLDTIVILRQSNPGSDTLARMVEYKDYVRNYLVAKALDQDSVEVAFYLLDQDSTKAAALTKYGIAADRGLLELADSLLIDLPNDGELVDFKAIQSIYLDWLANDFSTYPGTMDSLYLEDMAASDFSVGAYARSMLSLFFGRVFDELPVFDEEYFAEERSTAPQGESSIQK